MQECPAGTYKNVTGSDKSLCFACPRYELPTRAIYVRVRGMPSSGEHAAGSLLFLSIERAILFVRLFLLHLVLPFHFFKLNKNLVKSSQLLDLAEQFL